MGLDISAYRNITKVDCVYDADGEPIHPVTGDPLEWETDYDTTAYANPDFPGRAEGVEDRAVYKAAERMGFRAGSYGGYNLWREELAKLAGYESAGAAWGETSGPFWELISFSDCEGTIGPVVSAKLARDFADWDERAKQHVVENDDGWFYAKYQDWRRAFEMAADRGMVSFH